MTKYHEGLLKTERQAMVWALVKVLDAQTIAHVLEEYHAYILANAPKAPSSPGQTREDASGASEPQEGTDPSDEVISQQDDPVSQAPGRVLGVPSRIKCPNCEDNMKALNTQRKRWCDECGYTEKF